MLANPLVGRQIDNYHVVSVLGSGGFGTVFLARDISLDRDVALKVLRDPLEEKHRDLFKREAKALAALSFHPAIVQIYAWGEHDGHPYFVLEFVASSVAMLLEANPDGLPWRKALHIAGQCAQALALAHEKDILHRDIKPANILIEPDTGQVKLADFGLAQLYGRGEITISGDVSGSPPYMSPEQASGQCVDHRSDIFSLGITLYQLLCGKRPFEGPDYQRQICEGRLIPLHQRRADLPSAVYDVVRTAMAPQPDCRFQSAAAFAAALLELLGQTSPQPKAVSRLRGLVFGTCAFLVVCAIGWLYLRNPVNATLAAAEERIEAGDARGAEDSYRGLLKDDPNQQAGLYGLFQALAKQGKSAEAREVLSSITDPQLREEGTAVDLLQRRGCAARSEIEQMHARNGTQYIEMLLARVDLAEGRHQEALDRLRALDRQRFAFRWQELEYLYALGQALYHTGEYAEAAKIFQEIQSKAPEHAFLLTKAYVDLTETRRDDDRRNRIHALIEKIQGNMKNNPEGLQSSETDLWRSRPLRCCLHVADAGQSLLAMETGLADAAPLLLGEALGEIAPVEIVERDPALLEDVLSEQALATLSAGEGRLLVGRLLGARLIIECSFGRLVDKDSLWVKIIDAETTRQVGVEQVDLPHGAVPPPWVRSVAENVWERIKAAYPLQGVLKNGNAGPEIDIGSSVGAKPGMRFSVLARPDRHSVLPGKAVVIESILGEDRAKASIEGFPAESIPNEGLYVCLDEDAGGKAVSEQS